MPSMSSVWLSGTGSKISAKRLMANKKGEPYIMDAETLQAFLAKPHDAIIAMNRPGKGAQLSPIWFVLDGESFFFGTQKATAKYTNIVRDPNISVIVNNTATHIFVTAHGRAEIVEAERYPEIEKAILEKYVPAEMCEQFA